MGMTADLRSLDDTNSQLVHLVYCHPERLIPESLPGNAPPYRDLRRRLALRQVCRQLESPPNGSRRHVDRVRIEMK